MQRPAAQGPRPDVSSEWPQYPDHGSRASILRPRSPTSASVSYYGQLGQVQVQLLPHSRTVHLSSAQLMLHWMGRGATVAPRRRIRTRLRRRNQLRWQWRYRSQMPSRGRDMQREHRLLQPRLRGQRCLRQRSIPRASERALAPVVLRTRTAATTIATTRAPATTTRGPRDQVVVATASPRGNPAPCLRTAARTSAKTDGVIRLERWGAYPLLVAIRRRLFGLLWRRLRLAVFGDELPRELVEEHALDVARHGRDLNDGAD